MRTRELKRRFLFPAQGEKALLGVKIDGVRVVKRNMSFLDDAKLRSAWNFAEEGNREAWVKMGHVPDVRWRVHVCCWAAVTASKLEGDFVEFGVNAGLFSMRVCDYLGFGSLDKRFYLFDTCEGIPTDGLTSEEVAVANSGTTRSTSTFTTLRNGTFPGSLTPCW